MADFQFNAPLLAEQRAIAAVLGALDDKIVANTALARTADELAEAMVKAKIIDREYSQLRDLATVTMGSSPPGSSYNEMHEGLPFYQGVRDFGFRTPSERIWTEEPVRLAQVGDILVSVRAPVGRVNLSNSTCCVGRGLAAVSSSQNRPATLYHLVQLANWAPFEAEGTVFGSINQAQLKDITLPVLREPDRLESDLSAIEALIAGHLAENLTFAELRDTLLPALMSGRLQVKDAERRVEDAV